MIIKSKVSAAGLRLRRAQVDSINCVAVFGSGHPDPIAQFGELRRTTLWSLAVYLIGTRMDTEAAFVRTTVALVTGALKVAAVGVVVSAQDTIVTARVTDPATTHGAVDIAYATITSSRHLRIGTQMPASG